MYKKIIYKNVKNDEMVVDAVAQATLVRAIFMALQLAIPSILSLRIVIYGYGDKIKTETQAGIHKVRIPHPENEASFLAFAQALPWNLRLASMGNPKAGSEDYKKLKADFSDKLKERGFSVDNNGNILTPAIVEAIADKMPSIGVTVGSKPVRDAAPKKKDVEAVFKVAIENLDPSGIRDLIRKLERQLSPVTIEA